ncbi:Villin-2 [Zea mays]|uniref:Villin-2 n=1 Tax=Zea mays TaxID=4577 RepID=A0A317Y415_MAIZE|nr:Villin-2 [Zea mays]
MSNAKVVLEPAFQGAGHKPGTEIWRIEDFKPVALPKSDYGKFYCGDSYIVLQTTCKGGAFIFDIHFWIGKDSSQDEAGTAAIKTVELDSMLGGRAVQHREPQCYESDKFLSYFKPCIIPMEGGFASGFKKPEVDKFETRLYICKGKRAIRVKEVPFSRSSLNHDDVFILDTENKIYQFNGANSNIQERAKALEVIQHLKEEYHDGVCAVAIVDDGKLQAESDSGEFWVLFGGFAPIGKKAISDDDVVLETTSPKLFSISNGQLKLEDAVLTKSILENTKCFLLDCGAELFVWVGRVTQVEDRKAASAAVEKYIIKENRPKTTRITQVIQGYENHTFKSKFESWPVSNTSGSASTEEGRGKVTALLKQKGVDVKGISKTSVPVNDEVPPLLDGGGKLEVWCIDGSAKTALPKEELGKFYSGDCYVVLYTYHSADKKEEFYLAYWIGKNSVQEDQEAAFQIANTTFNSLKGRPVQGRIYQGKEPPQFVAIFQPMVILKGGTSSGYKKFVEEKGLKDETYCSDGTALIQISGTAVHNNKTLQVDAVATSLSSTDCFVLQAKNSMFIWNGNASSFEQQQWAAKVAEFLKLTCTQVTEIFNFSQDDLLTEDMMILDTHCEVFVWMGQCVETKEKQKAFDIGQIHGNSFEKKLSVLFGMRSEASDGGPTQRASALAALSSALNPSSQGKQSDEKPTSSDDSEHTQRASAMAALSSALNPSTKPSSTQVQSHSGQGSQRAAAVAALSNVLTAEGSHSPRHSRSSPTADADKTELVPTSPHQLETGTAEDVRTEPDVSQEQTAKENGGQTTFSYERLISKSTDPVSGINNKRRETYLVDSEFETVFGMTKEEFYEQPRWKQELQKKKADLF